MYDFIWMYSENLASGILCLPNGLFNEQLQFKYFFLNVFFLIFKKT